LPALNVNGNMDEKGISDKKYVNEYPYRLIIDELGNQIDK